ncbi:Right handed beta helix region [Mariniphaga anaerophila]|uniref:Right handed beta helix region n=1 Tax=Mariniphaga anaerophila TaxID=1484053 RepID=A0A1M4TKR7_9BACT|nr:right-handed parallel beta-helix repeat-containing protein [Mariniphaga anaerophila]SHE44954.1 Right handed beta helix region [Mariniphaga anaerophila]
MKTKSLKATVLFIAAFLFSATAFAADFFVSPHGNDSAPGTQETPFATIQKGVETIAEIFRENPNEDCTLWLADGMHHISKPIVFDGELLKNKNGKFQVKAIPGEHPIVSGGIEITEWKKLPEGLWKAELPGTAKMNHPPRELFVGSQRATRARFPNNGYLRVAKAGSDRRTHFFFQPNDFPVPAHIENVELVLLHDWSISRIPVKEIDVSQNKLTAVDSIGAKNPSFFNIDHWEPNPRYYLENAIEFLDADFEWYFHPKENAIYLKLPETTTPGMQAIVLPYSAGLVILEGKENQPIKNIHFEGIAFRHSAWQIPESGYCGVQACHFDPRPEREGWAVVPAAINGEWAENCAFINCTFQNLGGSGVWLATGSKNCTISNSRFSDISGNGIMIGEGRDRKVNGSAWWQSAPEQVAQTNTINNCEITECGQQFYGAVGVWCGLTAETTIRNNTIFNLPYSGISIGWMWSPVPTPCRENTIDGNHIHHIMQVLSDGGGVYMLGLQPGSKITNNRIHDVSLNVGRAESNGMFLDEGTTDVIVANNLIYNIAKSPLRFHRATTNLVKENYLFCGENVEPIRYNTTKEEDIKKVDNHVFHVTEPDFNKQLQQIISGWKIKR